MYKCISVGPTLSFIEETNLSIDMSSAFTSLFRPFENSFCERHERPFVLRFGKRFDRSQRVVAVFLCEFARSLQTVRVLDSLEGGLDVPWLREPTGDHLVQLLELGGGEEDGRRGQTEFEVRAGWLPEHLGGGDEVEVVIDQLEGDSDVSAVLEGGLHLGGRSAGENRVGLAAVGDQGGRLVEGLVEVQLEPLRLVLLVLELLEFAWKGSRGLGLC